MTEEEKVPGEQDDMEAFDEMERNFHRVVSDLVADRSLDKFRQEYEKLHAALVTSHEHNSTLIEKCRTLNNEILANANKVSSVMTLSQNDQRTIAGLRHEFEKAWKLVEVSQDRENKSKEVVENLKMEISNLSRLVDQGGTLAFTQESSLQEITDSITGLKKEIAVQAQQLIQMNKDVKINTEQADTMKKTLESLTKEHGELSSELEKQRGSNKEVQEDSEQIHNGIQDVQNNYKVLVAQHDKNVKKIAKEKRNIVKLEADLKEEERTIKSTLEDKKMNLQAVQTVNKVLEDKFKSNKKVVEEMDSYNEKFAIRDERMAKLEEELKDITTQVQKNQTILQFAKDHAKDIEKQKSETRSRLQHARQEVYLLNSEAISTDSHVKGMRRELEKSRTEHHNISSEKGSEAHETVFIESQNHILSNELLGEKAGAHDQRGKIVRTNEEIEEYQIKASGARSNKIQIQEEIKIREQQLDEENIHLSKLYQRLKHQDSMLEAIQNERDLGCRLLEVANADNTAISDENKALMVQIKALKEQIREKDSLCLQTHLMQKKILKQLVSMNKEIKELNIKIKEADTLNTEHRNKIQRAIYLLSQAELDEMKQKQVVTDLSYSELGYNTAIIKKTSELEVLKKKVHLIMGFLSMGNMAYRTQSEQLVELKSHLAREVEIQKQLMQRGDHRRALQLEQIRIQRTLLIESGKGKALEEELEKPMNVHRWRFLDGTNPELAQLLRMNHELRDRLMLQITIVSRLLEKKKKLKESANVLDKHLSKSYGGDIQEEFNFLHDVLRQKQKQLLAIQERVVDQQDTVTEHKDQLLNMRTMIREEKTEYFNEKKKVDEIRATTSIDKKRSSKNKQNQMTESRFIGGGFAVSSLVKDDSPDKGIMSPNPKRPNGAISALASPHIIQPRSASTIQKRIPPRGWNPSRAPIKPLLPTVTNND